MSAAYDQGVEDGARQERERVREALLSLEVAAIVGDGCKSVFEMHPASGWDVIANYGIYRALDHLGLGAVTTEESEK